MPEHGPTGILGGTFDPVHYAHLRLAQEACDALSLSRVVWIPAGQPPHRAQPRTPAAQRLEMTRLAIAHNPAFLVDDAEVRSERPSYTVPTLERLRAAPAATLSLVLLLGVDAFLALDTWHRWRELFDLAHIAVANRPGYPLRAQDMAPPLAAEFEARHRPDPRALRETAAGCVVQFEMTPLAISATAIRALLGAGRSARYLLPDPVLDYIHRNHLYSAALHGR